MTIARVGAGAFVSFTPQTSGPTISLDPIHLPYYAARSTLRMFVALIFSVIFSIFYGYIAAYSRRAERVMVPLLDLLQSVPVLGFLSVTVTGFIALFRGNLIGLEAASIFAIFTSQVWNMAFSFYNSLRTVPHDLNEAATLYRLSRWERFTRVEVPWGMIGLIWNGMISFGGGWFFVSASEAITVLHKSYTLPGIGSYVAAAIAVRDFRAICFALLTMTCVIIIIDQLFWKPLMAWSDRFRVELNAADTTPRSWLLNLLRSANILTVLGQVIAPFAETIDRLLSRLTRVSVTARTETRSPKKWVDRVYNGVLLLIIAVLLISTSRFVLSEVGLAEVRHTTLMGLATFSRTVILLIIGTLIWTPIGVAIGFNPRLARFAQPAVQLIASFPANFLFPFATIAFIALGISLNWGSILLMALGAQWYILFNVIAGAMSIPTDLREMARNMGIRGWTLWRTLIIPGIFSSWLTGSVTAMGGAWNASIIAETVSWGSVTLTAMGLGAYITQATTTGDWPRIALGIGMMSLFVVTVNRVLWNRLYDMAKDRYSIDA